jgi:hypothetical protein
MSVIEEATELVGLIKKVGDAELYRRIVKLEGEVIELTRSKRNLEEENYKLQERLRIKQQLTFRENRYFLRENDKEAGPYCSVCWDRENILVRMHDTVYGMSCPACVQDRLTTKRKS